MQGLQSLAKIGKEQDLKALLLGRGKESKDKSKRRIRKRRKEKDAKTKAKCKSKRRIRKKSKGKSKRQKENKSFFALFLWKECADYFAPNHGEEKVFLDHADFRE